VTSVGGDHWRQESADHPAEGDGVDGEGPLDGGFAAVQQLRTADDAGVVDQDVDGSAAVVEDLLREAGDVAAVRQIYDVDAHGCFSGGLLFDEVCRREETVPIPVPEDEAATQASEADREKFADTRRRSSDENSLTVEGFRRLWDEQMEDFQGVRDDDFPDEEQYLEEEVEGRVLWVRIGWR